MIELFMRENQPVLLVFVTLSNIVFLHAETRTPILVEAAKKAVYRYLANPRIYQQELDTESVCFWTRIPDRDSNFKKNVKGENRSHDGYGGSKVQ
jgi:hypothetical protein